MQMRERPHIQTRPPLMWTGRPSCRRTCPHCQADHVHRYGLFVLRDGTRRQRYLCKRCGRTFIAHTNTPLAYMKKRDRWKRVLSCMRRQCSLRKTAALVRVHLSTAFRWRHIVLHAVAQRPQRQITGQVLAGDYYLRYSEKGSRHTGGPGAHRRTYRGPLFQRFRHGRAHCVLLLRGHGAQGAAVIVGQERLRLERLKECLGSWLQPGSHLFAHSVAPFAEACDQLGFTHQVGSAIVVDSTARRLRFQRRLYFWLGRFRGVASKYLANYLCWYLSSENITGMDLRAPCVELTG